MPTFMEPVLFKTVCSRGAQARVSTEYLNHEQEAEVVTTTCLDPPKMIVVSAPLNLRGISLAVGLAGFRGELARSKCQFLLTAAGIADVD